MRPDLIVHNAQIATCDGRDSRHNSLAVWRDRICAVGADHEVLALASAGTRVVDLNGRFVCPGFIDCHVHLSSWAVVTSGREINLDGTASLAQTLERIGRCSADGWLRGRGWDKNHWPEQRFPTAADLDAVTGDIPAVFPSHDGHSLWANSAAMRAARVPLDIDDPPGGRILRDAIGRPSGVFQEAACALVWDRVPDYEPAELADALRKALPVACALGLTGVHNMEARNAFRAVQSVCAEGGLSLRVARYFPASSLDAAEELALCSGLGDEWIRIAGVKTFLDGALGAQTAAMLEPYDGSEDGGALVMAPEELRELVCRATRSGLATAVHAIGDLAVHVALDAYESAKTTVRGPWPRHRIEHAQHVHPSDVTRCGRLKVVASMQPVHMLADIDTCERHLASRRDRAFPLRSILEANVPMAFGSDAPVEVIDPLEGIRAAVRRQRRTGGPDGGWCPQQRLTARQALRGYTIGAAFASGEEAIKGSLEVGKLADFVLVSHDLTGADPDALAQARVLATVAGGRVTHDPEGVLA